MGSESSFHGFFEILQRRIEVFPGPFDLRQRLIEDGLQVHIAPGAAQHFLQALVRIVIALFSHVLVNGVELLPCRLVQRLGSHFALLAAIGGLSVCHVHIAGQGESTRQQQLHGNELR